MLADMPKDLLMGIFPNIGFAGLRSTYAVSQYFKEVARLALGALYGIKCGGRIYLYYATIICKFNALQAHAFEGQTTAAAISALQGCQHYMDMKDALEAEFGFCLQHGRTGLWFSPRLTWLEMLDDVRKTSALPYLLGGDSYSPEWVYCIQAMANLRRFDLLGLLTFPGIEEKHFYALASVPLPAFIVRAAARSLQRQRPDLALSELLAFAVLQNGDARVPKGHVPLFILQYMHKDLYQSLRTGCLRVSCWSSPFHSGCTFWGGKLKSSRGFCM